MRVREVRTLRHFAAIAALFVATGLSATPQAGFPAQQAQTADPLHDAAVRSLNRAYSVMRERGESAALNELHEAVEATRQWLARTGRRTPDTDKRLAAIVAICTTDFSICHPPGIRTGALDLELLLDTGFPITALHRANEARLRGFRALIDILSASDTAPIAPGAWRPKTVLDAAAGKAKEADWAFTEAFLALYPTPEEASTFKGWTRQEYTVLLSSVARAAESAYLSGNCKRATMHADRLLRLIDDIPAEGLDYPPGAVALTVKAECSIWYREPLKAYQFAREAIALEEREPNGRIDEIEGLDIRGRFRASVQLKSDPREAGAMAAILLLNPPKAANLANIPDDRELIDNLILWTSTRRPSALSDAIAIHRLANSGTGARRSAVQTLIAANAEVDRARRALAANRPGSTKALEAAGQALRGAEAEAKRVGVRLPDTHASFFDIADVLHPGEGFLFLYRSQFGPIIWGVSAGHQPIVAPPTQAQWVLYAPHPNPAVAPETVLSFVPPAIELSRPSMGSYVRDANWFLSRPQSQPDNAFLADMLKRPAMEFGPPLKAIQGYAKYWSIAFNEEFDGFPLAQLPLLSEEEVAGIQSDDSIGPSSRDRPSLVFDPMRSFGYQYAYAVVPSPQALVALRQDEPRRPALPYLGVGDIPFRGRPCTEIADGFDASLPAKGDARGSVLNRRCLAQSGAQLAALRRSSEGRLLEGVGAREAALDPFRNQAIGRLVFSTHGIEPNNEATGGWPALLLYPPDTISNARDDGVLTPLEVADLGFRAELVVLSACSTGFEDRVLGEEPLAGMAYGFFLGGARSVVLTRWQLRINIGLMFNAAFAEALDRGLSRAEAMREARRRLIATNAKPWQWGVVELVGEGGPMP